jgi:hypothetical protein
MYRYKRTARAARRKGETTVKCKGGWKNKKYKR